MAAKTTTKAAVSGARRLPPNPPSTSGAQLSRRTANSPAAKMPGKAAAKSPAPATVTVNLKHLSAEIAERHDMAKKQAGAVLTNVFEMLATYLKSGHRVRIGGLGILEVKNRAARMGRNPATGVAIQIKASKKIAFRAAKELKDAI